MASDKTKKLIGPTAYAKHRGVNLSSVKAWIKEGKLEGCLTTGSNGRIRINYELADKVLDGGKVEDEKPQVNQSSLTKARTAKTALEAKTAQLKYEQMSGNLVNKSDVVRVAREMGSTTKEAMLTIPDRLAPILAPLSDIDEINHVLTQSIDEALRNLAIGNWDFFAGDSDERK